MAISNDTILRCSCGCGWMLKKELVLLKESKTGGIVESDKKIIYTCNKCKEVFEEVTK